MSSLHLNLSSEPFRRDRPILVASAAVAVAMAITLGVLIMLAVAGRDQAKEARANVERVETQLRALSAEQARIEAVLRKPENAEVLERNVFVNALLVRKGISWTKIFADLEEVTPYNVRLISIRLPQITSRNEIQLDMKVAAQAGAPVLQMMKRLEESPLFGPPEIYQWTPPTQSDPLFKYSVSVNYGQKL
jgi:type IV pilus assembly protein PilN